MQRTGVHFSRAAFYRWLQSGEVAAVKWLDHRYHIPWSEIERLIAQHSREVRREARMAYVTKKRNALMV